MIPAGETCRIQSQEVSAMSRLPFESNTIPRGDRSCAAVAGPLSLSGPSARPSANCGPTRSTSEALKNYRAIRTQEGASPTTCNRELGYLRTAMRTAAFTTPPMLSMTNIPKFPIVSENEFARQGFTEDADFEKVVTTLPAYLVPLATVAYNSGIRRGELMHTLGPSRLRRRRNPSLSGPHQDRRAQTGSDDRLHGVGAAGGQDPAGGALA